MRRDRQDPKAADPLTAFIEAYVAFVFDETNKELASKLIDWCRADVVGLVAFPFSKEGRRGTVFLIDPKNEEAVRLWLDKNEVQILVRS